MTLKGTFPVLCTPFHDDGTIDHAGFDRLVEFILEAGADGCVYPGVASEVDTLSDDERADMVARLGARLNGRIPFIVGASADSPATAAYHVHLGAEAGAACAMVMAPAKLGTDDGAHTTFFRQVAKVSAIPIMLQNAPSPIGAGLSAETVATVASAIPGVQYVKEETMPCGQNLTLIQDACGDAIKGVFGGAGGRYITDELARGSLGTMPASELADLHVALVRAWRSGDEAEARRLFMVSMPALNFQAIFRMHMTKETLRLRGVLDSTHVRGKGPVMDAGDRAELHALLDQLAPELTFAPLALKVAAE